MQPLLEVENLKKYFNSKTSIFGKVQSYVKAVDGVSFSIKEGETLGIVGESGCGKSTMGRTILKLLEANGGKVYYQGKDVFSLDKHRMKKLRSEMQIIFQDPYSSLNPRMTICDIVGNALIEHNIAKGKALKEKVQELIIKCGLSPYHLKRYPHEFSGGQRQRIGIARALAVNPKFIVCDEPVSALDVSIQAQVINLLIDLQKENKLTYLFISHDLSVVKHISTRIGVMYLGKIVELADNEELFNNTLHPYTKSLLSAIPIPDPTIKVEKVLIKGDVPSSTNHPTGCKFHTRCPYTMKKCKVEIPILKEVSHNHFVACHLISQ